MARPAAATRTRSAPATPPAVDSPGAGGWRDPWLWLAALSVLPLVVHSLGAPLGEPVAEDFDFIRHWHLLGRHSLLDGGGSLAFWRPVPHQLYYAALGDLIVHQPRWVAALHAILLAVSAVLLYRAFRPALGGFPAFVAASFPFLSESVRTVISWPSHGVELCSLLFAAAAVHEASRRRLATCLAALLLALLSKELAVVTALLIPLMPGLAGGDRARALAIRARWAIATGVTTAAWGVAYLLIRRGAGLALPHQLESDPASLAVPFLARMGWACWNGLRAMVSLPATAAAGETPGLIAAAVLLVFAAGLALATPAARRRLGAGMPWLLWGGAWFALSSVALTTMFPIWAPNRVLFGSVGLGVALAAFFAAGHAWLPAALVALRLAAFAVSPGPSRTVGIEAAATGAFMDFPQLTRLQRLMADTRGALQARFPTLPPGSQVGQHNLPRRAEYAFGGDRALQVWYGDTTLRWVRFESYSRDTTIPLATIVEYQVRAEPQMALVDPPAMRGLMRGLGLVAGGDLAGAVRAFGAAEAAQGDPAAGVFLGTVVAKGAVARMGLGELDDAVREARRALGLWPQNPDSRYVLAAIGGSRGELAEAEAQLDTLLSMYPEDADARELRDRIRKQRGLAPGP